MTDRIKGFTVTLDRDIRDDDFEAIANAVRMIKGVIDVHPSIDSPDDHINKQRVRWEIRDKFMALIKEL
jgi:hypothetical protein